MKYDGALAVVNQVIELAQPGSPVLKLAKQERERVLRLMAAPPPKPKPDPEDDDSDE